MDGLWATKSKGVGLIDRAISFQDFEPVWSWSTNVTDRQTDRRTDRRTTCNLNTALWTSASRGKNWLAQGPSTARWNGWRWWRTAYIKLIDHHNRRLYATLQKTAATERRNDGGSSSTAAQCDDVGTDFDADDVALWRQTFSRSRSRRKTLKKWRVAVLLLIRLNVLHCNVVYTCRWPLKLT